MRTIVLEIDDFSATHFDNFSPETKKQITSEISGVIRKVSFQERVSKLKKIIDEINNDPDGVKLNPDIVLQFLSIEED